LIKSLGPCCWTCKRPEPPPVVPSHYQVSIPKLRLEIESGAAGVVELEATIGALTGRCSLSDDDARKVAALQEQRTKLDKRLRAALKDGEALEAKASDGVGGKGGFEGVWFVCGRGREGHSSCSAVV
jgi:hypothetical protein